MGYQLSWFLDGMVVLSRYYGEVSLEDIEQANAEALFYLNNSDRKLHVLLDQTEQKKTFLNLKAVKSALPVLQHPNLGWVVSFGGRHQSVDFLNNVLAQATGIRYRSEKTLQEAFRFLCDVDIDLAEQAARQ